MKYLLILLVLILVGFNLFAHIDQQLLCEFDEARHVASAMEMLHNHNFVVTYYGGAPDYWNAKPPLSEWGAALGYEVAPNPFMGVRLFSLVSALACCLVVFSFARRLAGFWAGLLAVALFITARPLLINHGARSADPDMLFIGLVSLGMLAFAEARPRFLALGYVALGLAFLTKSFHAGPYCVAAFVYTCLLYRQQRLKLYQVMLLPLCWLLPILPWALSRYAADGWRFFHVMLFYDVIARSTTVIEGHMASHWLYVNRLFLAFGLLLLTPVALLQKQSRQLLGEPRMQLLLLWALLPLGLYSLSQSKLPWYVFPVFPAFAVLIAVAVQGWLSRLGPRSRIALAVVVVLTLVQNETIIAGQILRNSIETDPVATAMVDISRRLPAGRAEVYLSDSPGQPTQRHYATSLMLGNIDLKQGGAQGYAAASGCNCFQINGDGSVRSGKTLDVW